MRGKKYSRFSRGFCLRIIVVLLFVIVLTIPSNVLAQNSACPEGQEQVITGSSVVTECWLFIFCDSYTVYSFDCVDVENGEDDDSNSELPVEDNRTFYFCFPNQLPVRDFLCQVLYRFIDSLLKQF